jgi:hypothetical protein
MVRVQVPEVVCRWAMVRFKLRQNASRTRAYVVITAPLCYSMKPLVEIRKVNLFEQSMFPK